MLHQQARLDKQAPRKQSFALSQIRRRRKRTRLEPMTSPTSTLRNLFQSLFCVRDENCESGEHGAEVGICPGDLPGHALSPAFCFVFFVIFAGIIFALHMPYLRLPYFWDEMGQFVPAALDLEHDGAWIPHSTAPNVHPPGVMAYLALVWRLAGFSIVVTRLAMLLIAAFGLLFAFLLGIELCRPLRAPPALLAPALLLFSPLFFTQSMLAQLDMPAMVLTLLALLLFLRQRYAACAFVCTLLVSVKETGIVAPGIFLLWLAIRERRLKQACYFLAPFVVLPAWLLILKNVTGHWLGNSEFVRYNVTSALNPAPIAIALVRRFYYLFLAEFRWVAALAIALSWRKSRLFVTPRWMLVLLFAAAHVLLVSVLGGATLQRYLLPVLPLIYIAAVASFAQVPAVWRMSGILVLLAGLIVTLFWDFLPAPFVFSLEDDMAMVDFIRVQQNAAVFLENHFANRPVATVWPFTQEISNPNFGYVRHPFTTVELQHFHPADIAAIDPGKVDVLAVYPRPWDLPWTAIDWTPLIDIQRKYFGYEPAMRPEEIQEKTGFVPIARWQSHRQWIEIYVRPSLNSSLAGKLEMGR